MASLSLKHIYKMYDGDRKPKKGEPPRKPAVSDFTMEIEDKEFIVFVGPSGCGKSTTLRMIAGLEDITSGELYIDGELVNNVEPKDRNIAMVFQNYALYPHMTVYDNMAFGLKLRRMPKAEIDAKVREAAAMLDIEEYLERKPKALSGGQRQRVALGRALVRNSKVFLLDEPLSNLDAKLRAAMRVEITRLHEKLGTTFIYVTHDQVEAMTMGTRIVVMKDGFIQQIGKPQELYDCPVNMFVAGFLGTPQMNLYDGVYSGGEITFANGQKLALTKTKISTFDAERLTDGMPVVLGIRPEDLSIKGSANAAYIDCRVDVLEELGSETILYGELDLDSKISKIGKKSPTSLVAKLGARCGLKKGETVKVYIESGCIHLFDKQSGIALAKYGNETAAALKAREAEEAAKAAAKLAAEEAAKSAAEKNSAE